jgi:hypothetical protein
MRSERPRTNADAEVTKMKDGATHFAHKAEQVDLDTGGIVAISTHGGATGDTTSMETTLPEAGLGIPQRLAACKRWSRWKGGVKFPHPHS